jgi:hypothetical protein
MNWFQQNRWLGTFLVVFGALTAGALYFLFHEKGSSEEALARFNDAATETGRLERLDPFPNEGNVKQMKVHLDNYGASLDKLKEDLKMRQLPAPPLAPSEFQSRLRQAMVAVAEKARANRVKLPDNFALGFEEFTAALPSTAAAPLLGQELSQVELLVNMVIDARVDAVTGLVRAPLPEERAPAPTPTPAPGRKPAPGPTPAGSKLIERNVIDLTFTSSPGTGRKILNQLGSAPQQFYILRTLHVHNEHDKGPTRDTSAAGANATAAVPTPTPPPASAPGKPGAPAGPALQFIVGNEHIETSARIEMLRFTF